MSKEKKQLTPEEKRKRFNPLRKHEDRQRALWLFVGGVECGLIIMILSDIFR